jgi:hypothetical protein
MKPPHRCVSIYLEYRLRSLPADAAFELVHLSQVRHIECIWCGITVRYCKEAPVPRYFFHFSDGKRRFSDTTGHDLNGLAAARAHAVSQVRDLKAAMCDPGIQDTSGWTMMVADAQQQTVFEIGFDLKVLSAES